MAGKEERPYFKSSISQLETLFEQLKTNPDSLKVLDYELSFRTTNRAAKLRSRIAETLGGRLCGGSRQSHSLYRARPQNYFNARAIGAVDEHPSSTTMDLGELPSIPIPQNANQPAAILAAWTALEALSPQTYRRPEDLAAGDRSCVVNLSTARVPWEIGERSRPKRQLYYQIILGTILMDRATEELVKAFGEDEERGSQAREKAAIAAVLVDKNGLLLEENGIAVSSFAWALPLALKLNLGALGAWPKIEPKIIEKLDDILRRANKDGTPIPLDLPTIEKAHRWLVSQFGLQNDLVEAPTFALRVYHYFKAKNPPEATLLNSFFLGDLARGSSLLSQGKGPTGLQRYLGIMKPTKTFDLLADRAALEKAVAPAMIAGGAMAKPRRASSGAAAAGRRQSRAISACR